MAVTLELPRHPARTLQRYLVDEINTEFYMSGGFAYAGNSGSGESSVIYTSADRGEDRIPRPGQRHSHLGSAFALGAQYGFTPSIAGKFEIMYVQLKSNSHSFTGPGGTAPVFTWSDDSTGHFTRSPGRSVVYHLLMRGGALGR